MSYLHSVGGKQKVMNIYLFGNLFYLGKCCLDLEKYPTSNYRISYQNVQSVVRIPLFNLRLSGSKIVEWCDLLLLNGNRISKCVNFTHPTMRWK